MKSFLSPVHALASSLDHKGHDASLSHSGSCLAHAGKQWQRCEYKRPGSCEGRGRSVDVTEALPHHFMHLVAKLREERLQALLGLGGAVQGRSSHGPGRPLSCLWAGSKPWLRRASSLFWGSCFWLLCWCDLGHE